jgi:hypothetical protein
MNLILIRSGYPAVAVRLAYLRALQQAQAGQGSEDFDLLLYQSLDATLTDYLRALQEALPPA